MKTYSLKMAFIGLLIVFIFTLFIGCAGKQEVVRSEPRIPQRTSQTEQMIWSSGERPGWTINEPRSDGPSLYFVGLSDKHANERGAREETRRDVANQVVNYLGVAVKDHFQEITTRFGLSSDISDPTNASRRVQDQFAAGVARQIKVEQWYIEQWQTQSGSTYYLVYGLGSIPKSVVEKQWEDAINQEQDNIRDKIKNERNAQAKSQMQDALNAFESMKGSGFID
jgi:hypothetical protein